MATKATKGESGWYFNEKDTAHYVSSYDGHLVPMSRCGKRSTTGWKKDPKNPKASSRCGRCELLRKQDTFRENKADVESGETPASLPTEESPREQTISLSMKVVGDVKPIAHIPIRDVQMVITLLGTQRVDPDADKLVLDVYDVAIKRLEEYVEAAEKQAELPESATWTYKGNKK